MIIRTEVFHLLVFLLIKIIPNKIFQNIHRRNEPSCPSQKDDILK